MEKLLDKRNTIIVVGLLTLWRLYLSAELELHPDEAYYWLWSRSLDMGYFDHPPLVAYFIWFTTLFSQSELWVRLSGTLVSLALSGLIWQLSLQLFRSVQVAAGSVILFNAYPLTTLGLLVMTPDTPVLLFWALGVYVFWQTMRSGKTWLWYVLGVTFGLALLSKYTAILMIPCFFIYLVLTDDRRWLKTIYPYVSLLIGFICFLPVVYWNSRHDWVSFAFQFRNGLGGEGYSWDKVGEYIGGQALVTGPIVWFVGLYAALVGLYRRDKQTLLLVSTAIPIILFFGLSSFRKVASPNWPAFAYVTFSILVTQYCFERYSKMRRAVWSVAVVSSLALSTITSLHARFNLIPLARFSEAMAVADATNQFHGWRDLGDELKKYPDKQFAVTPSHQLSAEIIYYTHASLQAQTARITRPSQFNLWSGSKEFQDKERLYVWSKDDFIGPNGDYFASAVRSRAINIYRDGRAVRTYYIVSGQKALIPPFYGN
jgi:4-amino-4-deoxy-L-arabinose transferase-like glycosyltransferase